MRPHKIRRIEGRPAWTRYLPEGQETVAETELGLDMVEALRLVDAEGLSQEVAAARMGISAPTLCRLLGEARRRVATALRDGMALRCGGGAVDIRPHGGHGFGPGMRAGHGPHGGRHAARPCRGRRGAPTAMEEELFMAEAQGRTTEHEESGVQLDSGPSRLTAADTGGRARPGRGRGRGRGRGGVD